MVLSAWVNFTFQFTTRRVRTKHVIVASVLRLFESLFWTTTITAPHSSKNDYLLMTSRRSSRLVTTRDRDEPTQLSPEVHPEPETSGDKPPRKRARCGNVTKARNRAKPVAPSSIRRCLRVRGGPAALIEFPLDLLYEVCMDQIIIYYGSDTQSEMDHRYFRIFSHAIS